MIGHYGPSIVVKERGVLILHGLNPTQIMGDLFKGRGFSRLSKSMDRLGPIENTLSFHLLVHYLSIEPIFQQRFPSVECRMCTLIVVQNFVLSAE